VISSLQSLTLYCVVLVFTLTLPPHLNRVTACWWRFPSVVRPLTNFPASQQVELAAPVSLGSEVSITDAEGNVMASAGAGAGAVLAVISADDQHWSDYIRAAPAA